MICKSPSNIALIKYMGKASHQKNIPANPSLSYTLEPLVSGVQLIPLQKKSSIHKDHPSEKIDCEPDKFQNSDSKKKPSHLLFDKNNHTPDKWDRDYWEPLQGKGWLDFSMAPPEQKRFLSFFKKLKVIFNLTDFYLVQSANNFPKNMGIASSASSFSALTLAAYQQALKELKTKPKGKKELSQISRQGSGSSCRSFFKPWCLWSKQDIQEVSFAFNPLQHDLLIFNNKEKDISSSKAHLLVETSPSFSERAERASDRLKQFLDSMKKKDWPSLYQIAKEEFEDMHQLFETSSPSFSYQTPQTRQALEIIEKFWKDKKDGPLVTMDAGSAIHLFYRLDQAEARQKIKQALLTHIPCIQFFKSPLDFS